MVVLISLILKTCLNNNNNLLACALYSISIISPLVQLTGLAKVMSANAKLHNATCEPEIGLSRKILIFPQWHYAMFPRRLKQFGTSKRL